MSDQHAVHDAVHDLAEPLPAPAPADRAESVKGGIVHIPRIGDEVVVSYIEQDGGSARAGTKASSA